MPAAARPNRDPDPSPVSRLAAYAAKRDFTRTSEPGGDSAIPSQGAAPALQRAFVVQKHWASHLHYDFRLELDGTLRSWALPKGPSLDPKVKRMAVAVEDHPLAYASFEGRIPAGAYGAGEVIVWDRGTWTPDGDPALGLQAGKLKFELTGAKLAGRWMLLRMAARGQKQVPWLLVKEQDAWARASADFSVVDALPDRVGAPLAASTASTAPAAPAPPQSAPGSTRPEAWGVPAPLPDTLAPQLASAAAPRFDRPQDWLCEIKFDGYRMLVRVANGQARFFTRSGHDWTAKLPHLQRAIEAQRWPPAWLDGELVVTNAAGLPDFGALQQALDGTSSAQAVLYLFDVPYLAGRDLRAVPLQQRRALLQALFTDPWPEGVRLSEAFDAAPDRLVVSACQLGLEGLVAKRRDAHYRSGRSDDWVKLKCGLRQEFVIGGYTDPAGSRPGFGALLLGVHDADGALQYVGKVGSGFSQHTLVELHGRMVALAAGASPFAAASPLVGSAHTGSAHWVQPVLLAEVSFAEWTRAAHIRHAVFRGLRTDKPARDAVREPTPAGLQAATRPPDPAQQKRPPLQVHPMTQPVAPLTHPERVIDPSTGITKSELAQYYGLVAALMMKHLKGRPVAIVRAPDGVGGPQFFQKHADTQKLRGIRQLDPGADPGQAGWLEIVNGQGLHSVAQLNGVELHTQNTVAGHLTEPNRMVFDLDPGAEVPWQRVQEAAELVRAFLAQLGLPAFLKTSGGKGLHVVVPLRSSQGAHGSEAVKGFSKAVVQHMARTIPARFVAVSGPRNRVGKIFIDYLRNGAGATTVCAWSARARAGMGISVPVAWSELDGLRGGDHWTVRSAHTRLAEGNAPWAAYGRAARGLTAAMAELGYTHSNPAELGYTHSNPAEPT